MQRTAATALWIGLLFVGVAAITPLFVLYTTQAVVLVALITAATCMALRPTWALYLTIILAVGVFPAFIVTDYQVGPLTVHAFEPFAVSSSLWIAFRRKAASSVRSFWLLATLFVGATLLGQHYGSSSSKILYDLRPLLIMLLGVWLFARVAGTELAPRCLLVLKRTLQASAWMTLAASLTGIPLPGRTEAAALQVGANVEAATRFLTAATFPALAVLCAVLALLITKQAAWLDCRPFLIPSVAILFLSFSRNSVLGIAAAMLFAVLAARSFESLWRLATRGVVVLAAVVLTVALAAGVSPYIPGGDWIDAQFSSYSERVINGLGGQERAIDESVLFRQDENTHLLAAWHSNPVLGHGFGYAYKPLTGKAGSFFHDQAPYFAHNFYLWLLAKSGLIGLALFLWAAVWPIAQSLKRASPETVALGAAATGLLAVSFVVPMPAGTPSSFTLGAILGLLTAAVGGHRLVAPVPVLEKQPN